MTGPATFSVALANETATARLMAEVALLIGPGDVVTLSGDLGAGKTAAARAMIRYLAGDDELEVPSPTFTLVQSYELPPFPLLHADLYRVNDPSELEEIGLSPLPDGTVALIEWPERAPGAMPADRIDIALSHRPALGSLARAAEITGHGKAAAQVERLAALRSFIETSGYADADRTSYARRRLDAVLRAAAQGRRLADPDECAAPAGRPGAVCGQELQRRGASRRRRPAVRRDRRTGCARAASRRRRSITPISNPAS